MERYKLSWTQSPDDRANSQDVIGTVNGGSETVFQANLPMNVAEVDVDFPTDAAVVFKVRTVQQDGTTHVDSTPFSFTASNPLPFAPATGLGATFVQHVP